VEGPGDGQADGGYYRHLLEGEGRSTALHAARKELRERGPPPVLLGPFIASGSNMPLRRGRAAWLARPAP
jgi:hypothetical protein